MPDSIFTEIPKTPSDLEDYVAALFQCAGYFVEKNIIERDPTDILELDIVATSYEELLPTPLLVEVKSGDWGYHDIFKLIGWMVYLNIKKGAFFVSKEKATKDPERIHQKVDKMLSFVPLGDFSDVVSRFNENDFNSIEDASQLLLWRLVYRIERKLIERLRDSVKTDSTKQGPKKILEYHNLINNRIFFIKDVRERLAKLYKAYQQHPRLALAVSREKQGYDFDPEYRDPHDPLLRETMIDGKYPELQACFYVEHRARLAILKAAIDYLCQEQASVLPPRISRGVDINKLLFDLLPQNFQDGLEEMKHNQYFKRYALFWQVFLWGFGGFYLTEIKDEEFALLSKYTGIPVSGIPAALRAFDLLFPLQSGSWLTSVGNTEYQVVKMTPTVFEGLGAIKRLFLYQKEKYEEFNFKGFTCNDLKKWHICTTQFVTLNSS